MSILVKIIGFLYRATFQALFNIIFNLYWLAHMSLHGEWYFTMRRKALTCEDPFNTLTYSYDGLFKSGVFKKWPTWTSLIGITYYRGRLGNCQDGAVYIRKRLKQNGENPKLRIYIPGINVSRIHYVVECGGYVYDLTSTLNYRKRKGTALELAQKSNPDKRIYFIQ